MVLFGVQHYTYDDVGIMHGVVVAGAITRHGYLYGHFAKECGLRPWTFAILHLLDGFLYLFLFWLLRGSFHVGLGMCFSIWQRLGTG